MAEKTHTIRIGDRWVELRKSDRLVGLQSDTTPIVNTDLTDASSLPRLGGFEVLDVETAADSRLDAARAHPLVDRGTHVYHPTDGKRAVVPTGKLILTFHPGVSPQEQQLVLDQFRLALVDRRAPHLLIARVSERSPNPIKVAEALAESRLLISAEPDVDIPLDEYAYSRPMDELFNQQWHLENGGIIPDVNYPVKRGADARVVSAWRKLDGVGSNRVTIAVIDNGFDLSHPDLKDKVVKPFDFWENSATLQQGDPDHTHGTPCASVALAANNGNGIVGSAPSAKFMPLHGTSFSLDATEQMFQYCIDHGADIVSCSWGTVDGRFQLNALKKAAIAKAAREGRGGKGCVILFAGGNDNLDYLNYYAQHPDVIAVGASTSRDEHALYSNRGPQLAVCAPSNGDWPILAARAWWDKGTSLRGPGAFRFYADGFNRGDRYKHFGGTSSATPLVAGICALLLSANPELTAREVKDILMMTADKIGQGWEYNRGRSLKYGAGRVNAERAVAEAIRRSKRPAAGGGGSPTRPTDSDRPSTGGGSSGPVPSTPASNQGLFNFFVQRQSARGFGVQVGVYAQYGNVLTEAAKLQRITGKANTVAISSYRGQTVYKLIAGPVATRSEGNALVALLERNGIKGGWLRNLQAFA